MKYLKAVALQQATTITTLLTLNADSIKVTAREFPFLLILVTPFNRSVATLAPALVKIFAGVSQRHMHLLDANTVMYLYGILYLIYVIGPKHGQTAALRPNNAHWFIVQCFVRFQV